MSGENGQLMTGASGGAETTVVGSLDMANERDLGLLHRWASDHLLHRRRRWGDLTPEDADQYRQALKVALRWKLEEKDGDGVAYIVKVYDSLVGREQADEHKALSLLAGEGKTTVNNTQINGDVIVTSVPPPRRARIE